VSLAVALGLDNLEERLPTPAGLGVVAGERAALHGLDGEHHAVGEVAVVRNGQDIAAGLLLVAGHVPPEVFGVPAVDERKGHNPGGAGGVVPEDDHAVKIVAAGLGGPLEANEGGEDAGAVHAVGDPGGGFPHRALEGIASDLVLGGVGALYHFLRCLKDSLVISGLDSPTPAPPGFRTEKEWIRGLQGRGESEILGVVGHDKEIERAGQLDQEAVVGRDLLPARKTEGLFGADAVVDEAGVVGVRGVEVSVAPVDVVRVGSTVGGGVGAASRPALRFDQVLPGQGAALPEEQAGGGDGG
jgi:hypothetical protein